MLCIYIASGVLPTLQKGPTYRQQMPEELVVHVGFCKERHH